MDESVNKIEQLHARIKNRFGDTVTVTIAYDEVTVELAPSDLLRCCLELRDNVDFQFNQLMDLCGVDYLMYGIDDWATETATFTGFSRGVMEEPVAKGTPQVSSRFAVVYHLLSTVLNHRIRLKVFVPNDPPVIPSVLNIWQSANWYERETFDLFGILFTGHPDLRRLLTDYGFIGHPFRKDFPLIGEVEMRYDASQKRVVYEPVSIQPRTLVPKVIRQVGSKENA